MKLALVQFYPEFIAKERNIDRMLAYVNNIQSDIIVFPELSTSGYYFLYKDELIDLADESYGVTMNTFQSLSKRMNKIIVYGFPEKVGDNYYNSAAILFPDEKLSRVYRKTHLFFKERFVFTPGDTGFFVVNAVKWDINIGVMICYDWRFPEASRTLGLKGADLIICPSNLVTEVWNLAMPARALENKVYLAVANRIGEEVRNGDTLKFNGMSAVYGYNGKTICSAGQSNEEIIYAEIYPEETRNKYFNEFNSIDSDRRPEMYFK